MNEVMYVWRFLYWMVVILSVLLGIMAVLAGVMLVGLVLGIIFNRLMDAIFHGIRYLEPTDYTQLPEDDEE